MTATVIEALVLDSYSLQSSTRLQSSEALDRLRISSDRWSVGLQLFLESSSSVAKFFGLSLIRDFMSYRSDNPPICERSNIRKSLFPWIICNINGFEQFEIFIVNNLVSIITLGIKNDYPEIWPNAFKDLLELGSSGVSGLDFVLRVMLEFEIEVVMYDINRIPNEIAHNSLIKDTIRDSPTASEVVQFICNSAIQIKLTNDNLCSKCLSVLRQVIGWYDINLITNSVAITLILNSLNDESEEIQEYSYLCLLEVIKKKMEPAQKITLLQSLNIINLLRSIRLTSEDYEGPEEHLAPVVNVLLLELFEFWNIYDGILYDINFSETSQVELQRNPSQLQESLYYGNIVSEMIILSLPLLLHIYGQGSYSESSLLLPSMTALVTLFKSQTKRKITLHSYSKSNNYFLVADYLERILFAIYSQMQYDDDTFEFDLDNEEQVEIMESKKESRRLFVSLCRVSVEPGLQFLYSALAALPQPLSVAPWPALECLLRLLNGIGDVGATSSTVAVNVWNGKENISMSLSSVLSALHQSDVGSHVHPQVLLAYYEVSVRNAGQSSLSDLSGVLASLTSVSGLRNKNVQLRIRSSYFLLKLCESLGNRVVALLSSVKTFSDLLLYDAMAGSQSPLTEQAELHLLEALSLVTSATAATTTTTAAAAGNKSNSTQSSSKKSSNKLPPPSNDNIEMTPEIIQQQQSLFIEIINILISQLHSLLSHPMLSKYSEQISEVVSHKLACMASLLKSFSYIKREHEYISPVSSEISNIINIISNHLCMYKHVRKQLLILSHRLVTSLGVPCLNSVEVVLAALLIHQRGDGEFDHALQLFNQMLEEYHLHCVGTVNRVLGKVLASFKVQYQLAHEGVFEGKAQTEGQDSMVMAAPHVVIQKEIIVKQYLLFLQYINDYKCTVAIVSNLNFHQLSDIIKVIIDNIELREDCGYSYESTLVIKRASICALASMLRGMHRFSNNVHNELLVCEHIPYSPENLSESINLLMALLTERILPTALQSLGGSGAGNTSSLNVNDAGTLSYIGDIGGLLWLLLEVNGLENLLSYMKMVMSTLDWPTSAIQELGQIVHDAMHKLRLQQNQLSGENKTASSFYYSHIWSVGNLNVFKDSFKKFIRTQNLRS